MDLSRRQFIGAGIAGTATLAGVGVKMLGSLRGSENVIKPEAETKRRQLTSVEISNYNKIKTRLMNDPLFATHKSMTIREYGEEYFERALGAVVISCLNKPPNDQSVNIETRKAVDSLYPKIKPQRISQFLDQVKEIPQIAAVLYFADYIDQTFEERLKMDNFLSPEFLLSVMLKEGKGLTVEGESESGWKREAHGGKLFGLDTFVLDAALIFKNGILGEDFRSKFKRSSYVGPKGARKVKMKDSAIFEHKGYAMQGFVARLGLSQLSVFKFLDRTKIDLAQLVSEGEKSFTITQSEVSFDEAIHILIYMNYNLGERGFRDRMLALSKKGKIDDIEMKDIVRIVNSIKTQNHLYTSQPSGTNKGPLFNAFKVVSAEAWLIGQGIIQEPKTIV